MAEDLGRSPDDVQFRFRDDEVVDHAAVTVDSCCDQTNATAVRIEPGDDARVLLPFLDRLALIEVNFPAFARLVSQANCARLAMLALTNSATCVAAALTLFRPINR